MPSPFPGMDPYLEEPGFWPDVHHELISNVRAELNVQLQPKYFARLEDRVYLSDETDPGRDHFVVPDVRVIARADRPAASRTAGAEPVAVADDVQPIEVSTLAEDELHETFIEVIDRADRSVVAVIEVLSPTNKVAGSSGRRSYLDKRHEVMRSPTHLVEIDLLRTGAPIFVRQSLPPHEYLAHVSRARADGRRRATVWPIPLRCRLPIVPVPLRNGDPDARIDIQATLAVAYERGAYGLDVDYTRDPVPPLTAEQAAWARQVVAGGNATRG